jgi:hypothetical protein
LSIRGDFAAHFCALFADAINRLIMSLLKVKIWMQLRSACGKFRGDDLMQSICQSVHNQICDVFFCIDILIHFKSLAAHFGVVIFLCSLSIFG